MKLRTILAALCALTAPLAAQEVSVQLASGSDDLRDALRDASLSAALQDDPNARPSDYAAAAQADYRRMLRALYGEGYYSGTVSIRLDGREAGEIPAHALPARIGAVQIRVDPGRRFTFGRASIAPLPANTPPATALPPGAPARAEALRDGTSAAIDAWRSEGHAKAALSQDVITADHRRHRLDAAIHIAPGPKLRFGALGVSGETRVRPERVRAISGLPTGQTFDPEALERATARLRRTGVFDTVVLREAEAWSEDLTLPITAELADRKPRRIGASAELSSGEGLRLSAFWLHRNLLGGAERLRIGGHVSGIGLRGDGPDGALTFSLTRPATWNPDNTLKLSADLIHQDDPNYRLDALSLYAGLSRAVNQNFTLDGGFGFQLGRAQDGLGRRSYTLLTLPLRASNDRRDDKRDPKRGYFIEARATPFLGRGHAGSGLRASVEARGYLSFAEDRLTLAGRITMGSLIGAQSRESPADFLFYSGGGGSVRGQAYQSLGVTLPNGSTIGGRSQAGLQAELRGRIGAKLGLVGFFDLGHIGEASQPLQKGSWHGGAGLGLRYATPLGPIRLDIATPTTGNERLRRAQFYVGLGQSF